MPTPRPRPPIWTDGRQSPPFDLRAFLRAATVLGQQMAGALLLRLSPPLGRLATDLSSGRRRIPPHRLGRLGRLLPKATTVGAFTAGLNGALLHANDRLRPGPARPDDDPVLPVPPWPPEGLGRRTRQTQAETDIAAIAPVVAKPVPAARAISRPSPAPSAHDGAEDDTLAAIRSLIGTHARPPLPGRTTVTRPVRPVRPGQTARPDAPPPERPSGPAGGTDRGSGLFVRLSGRAVAAMALLALFPAGLARAAWLWAQGRDLRDPDTYG